MLTSCIMTKEAPRGLKTLSEAGNRTDFSRNGNTFRKQVNLGNSEVEYIESENLKDVEDVGLSMKTLLTGLESKDWVLVCEALNDVRRLSMFHREACLICCEGNVISLIVKSLKNPRSVVCKTAIMTSGDIFKAYRDSIVDSTDPLQHMGLSLTDLQDLQGVDGIKAYGIDKLIQLAASQLSDQLPESREAAHALLLELQNVYEKTLDMTPTEASEDPQTNSWEHFCNSKLSPSSAQVVLRVTNVAR
ncbi:hypothetical protein T459_32830 [Capsicum annuum]|uniref:Uncharacterized protein n=1 Tax=Capsicum annuum TaxID=4072 RepID=A0A2G2Y0R6_CAPAN|nr:hypothetical protein T459_32830 [Capsicum annuum]